MDTIPASFVVEQQLAWSRRREISLQGSKGVSGRPMYAPLERNLFEPLSPEARDELDLGPDYRAVSSVSRYPTVVPPSG